MNDEALADDLEYIASRTFGIVGDKERAATFTTAAARLRALNVENAKLRAGYLNLLGQVEQAREGFSIYHNSPGRTCAR